MHPPSAADTADSPNSALPDSVLQRLLEKRIVFLGQEVDDAVANRLCAEILLLSAEDRTRDITLYINSPGGSVTAGLAVYDAMRFVPNDVATVAMGMAGSMGQVLLCAGTAGKRYALPHSRVIMHQPHGGVGGTSTDIRIQAEQMRYLKRVLAERTAFHTGQPVERIEADGDRDRWFNAPEAKEYGFVDHVVRDAADLPVTVSAG
ncbi:ClpP family protease [Marinactinospora rubrisoli]|uniref:ATP-dependent Clp protease proteolytic subunit n=1 Tax=Marinactinospora rubrisoli TaxID=2715399 RepID=A0ABW2KGY3_9ACTN